MTRSEILDKAKEIITKDRNSTHGEPEDSFSRIAAHWSTYLNRDITVKDVAIMMTLFKIARADYNPEHSDNWIDAIGYLACGAELTQGIDALIKSKRQEPVRSLVCRAIDRVFSDDICGLPIGHNGPHSWASSVTP